MSHALAAMFISVAFIAGCDSSNAGAAQDGGIDSTSVGDGAVDGGDGGNCTGQQATHAPISGRLCSVDDWCWEHPLPQGNNLNSVWPLARDDVWFAGERGTILHFDGTAISPRESGTQTDLASIWAGGSADAWAVGTSMPADTSVILHWDGNAWAPVTSAPSLSVLRVIWGAASNDVWIAGAIEPSMPLVMHWDGATWSVVGTGASADFMAIDGTSASNVWAVGGQVMRWNGAVWSPVSGTPQGVMTAVWAAASDDAWFVDSLGNLFRWRMGNWSTLAMGGPNSFPHDGIWGASAADVWAVGFEIDRASTMGFTAVGPRTERLNDVRGTASDDVWVVGDEGQIDHYDGGSWSPLISDPIAGTGGITAIAGTAADELWAAAVQDTNTVALHRTAAGWEALDAGTTLPFRGVWTSGPTDVWFVGLNGIRAHWNGSSWRQDVPATSAPTLDAVWGANSNDVWVVGSFGNVQHWDGTSWTPAVLPGQLAQGSFHAVWGSASNDVWAAGDALMHWNGQAWTAWSAASFVILGLWGTSANDIWAVGQGGLAHWDGVRWSTTTVSTTLYSVNGRGTNDVFAVGRDGVHHWDGCAWNAEDDGTATTLSAVLALPGGPVWIGGVNSLLVQSVNGTL